MPTWACATVDASSFRSHRHCWTPSLVQKTDSPRRIFFSSRQSITFNSSLLTHVFRYDSFSPLDELYFYSSLRAHPVAQIFLSFVSIAYELAPGNFFGTRFTRTGKKFRRLACTITRCALEHFFGLDIGCFEHIFLHLAHRTRNGDWRGSLGCCSSGVPSSLTDEVISCLRHRGSLVAHEEDPALRS